MVGWPATGPPPKQIRHELNEGGSEKQTVANTRRLVPLLKAAWYNADTVRKLANDWDFSEKGRVRQADRMRTFADFEKSKGRFVVCDFICPTKEARTSFSADIVIWMNTIKKGRFEDTNKLFQEPEKVDFQIKSWNHHNI